MPDDLAGRPFEQRLDESVEVAVLVFVMQFNGVAAEQSCVRLMKDLCGDLSGRILFGPDGELFDEVRAVNNVKRVSSRVGFLPGELQLSRMRR